MDSITNVLAISYLMGQTKLVCITYIFTDYIDAMFLSLVEKETIDRRISPCDQCDKLRFKCLFQNV